MEKHERNPTDSELRGKHLLFVELMALRRLMNNETVKSIATRCELSEDAIYRRIQKAYKKLGCNNPAAAAWQLAKRTKVKS